MSVRDREDAVITRLEALAPHLDGEPDPDFRATTRARLVAMAAVRSPEPEPVSPLRRLLTEGPASPAPWRTRLTGVLAGAALAVTSLATVVAVASDARPGDLLYDLKRGTEETQLALAGDARGETLLDLASTRLDEVRELVDTGATALPAAGASPSGTTVLAAGADAALVVETLATMDAQTAEGAAWLAERAVRSGDADPLDLLADWTGQQSADLADLRDDVPAGATDDVDASLDLLSDVAVRVSGLDATFGCPAGPATAGADELGPVPALCVPEGSTATAPDGAPSGSPGNGEGTGTGADPDVPAATSTAGPQQLPGPAVPSVGGPTPGLPDVGTGGGAGSGAGGGAGGVVPPTTLAPPLPTGVLPRPPLPSASSGSSVPSVPSLVPRLPGASISVPTPSAAIGGTPLPSLDVCLGPITIGDC